GCPCFSARGEFTALCHTPSTKGAVKSASGLRWARMVLTYVLPLLPFACWWDVVVSQFRAYTVEELKTLAKEQPCYYSWDTRTSALRRSRGHLTYLLGRSRF